MVPARIFLLGLAALLLWSCKPTRGPVPGMEQSGVALSASALRGRVLFRQERCASCHIRGGPPPSAFQGAQPLPLGRRIGPNLADVGGRYTVDWHLRHLRAPSSLRPGSTMPAYPWLFGKDGTPRAGARDLVAYLREQRDPLVDRDTASLVAAALDASPTEGAVVFARSCAGCHGPKGAGDGAGAAGVDPSPRDLTAAAWKFVPWAADGRPDREALTRLVARGVPGTLMPGAQLRPGDLAGVVEYTRTLAPVSSPSEKPVFTGPDGSETGRARGQRLYAELGCDKCHGPGARGTERGPDLVGRVSRAEPSAGALAGLVWRGIPGTTMPSYGAALKGEGAPRPGGEAARPPLDALVGWLESARAAGP